MKTRSVESEMLAISATDEWRAAHPGATIGLLELSGVENTRPSSRVNERKGESEQMTQMNGAPKAIRSGDMIMRDADGICCSIIYGQDARSPISPETSRVLYVAYAPAGIAADTVEGQLRGIEENLRLFSAAVLVEQHRLLTT